MNDLDALAKLAQALSPWHAHLVFIGGWAHRIHRFSPRANQLTYQPVFTRDTDLAFANKVPIEGDIKAALAEHGFREQLTGEYRPPVAHYTLGDENGGFYAEFLTPLTDSAAKRRPKPDVTMTTTDVTARNATMTMAGISAQQIRYLDILLVDPWLITLSPQIGIPVPASMDVQVANPLCYMVQKFLIQSDRPAAKQAQDVLYIYDTIELFGALLDEFHEAWESRICPALGKKLSKTVLRSSEKSFSNINDVIRAAARIPQDRRLSSQQIQQTCQMAFETILQG
ncbi:GSU2403 family nucleotidyltransferase fold protein [Actimicrobium antarcticum]|uniref:Nucleotidyltransferase-like domain-containing protein n=1 Tax=Actimicrobium antarcticum TaxID=1051899 RepID=A0ABP7SX03_9BURK